MRVYSAREVVNREKNNLLGAINVEIDKAVNDNQIVFYMHSNACEEALLNDKDLGFLEKSAVFKDDIGRGGGMPFFGEIYSPAQFLLILARDIILYGVLYDILKRISKNTWNIIKKAKRDSRPFKVVVQGEKDSLYFFQFFYFFDDQDFEGAWEGISQAVDHKNKEVRVAADEEVRNRYYNFYFDTKKKKWFEIGEETCTTSDYKEYI